MEEVSNSAPDTGTNSNRSDTADRLPPPKGYQRLDSGLYVPGVNPHNSGLVGRDGTSGLTSPQTSSGLVRSDGTYLVPPSEEVTANSNSTKVLITDQAQIGAEAAQLGPLRAPSREEEAITEEIKDAKELLLNFAGFLKRKISEAIGSPTDSQKMIISRLFADTVLESDLDKQDIEVILTAMLKVASSEYVRDLCTMVHTNSVSHEISVLLAQASVLLEIVKPVDSDLDDPTIKSTLMDMLHTLHRRDELYQLYALLEQVELSKEEKSKILNLMTAAGHLHGNLLASKLGMNEYKRQESDWISKQEKLRNDLLERLKRDPQFLYDQFDELYEAVDGLLFARPPKEFPYKTKIGFEFEGAVRKGERASLPPNLFLGRDVNGLNEIRLRREGVPFDSNLQQEFVELWCWIRHNFRPPTAARGISMHFHLDQTVHPRKPTFGGLYPDIRDNGLGTREQRGFYPPKSPEITLAIIEASIRYSKMNDKEDEHIHNSSINIRNNYPERWQHLLWGMICTKIDDPHTRLCMLVALKDPHALIGFSEKDVYQTFGDELFSPHCNIEEIIPGLGVYKVAIRFLAAQADLPLDIDSRPDTVSLSFPSGHGVDSPEEIVADIEQIKHLTTELGQLRIDTDPEAMNSMRINRAIEIVIRGLSENYNVKLLGSLKLLFQKEKVPQIIIDQVRAMLDDEKGYVRSAALGALQPLLERENLPDWLINRVKQMLDDEKVYVRAAALEALKPLFARDNQPEWLINRVKQMLDDEYSYVRLVALEALEPLFGRDNQPEWLRDRVQRMLDDRDRNVRLVALRLTS
jgi:hypothetical protein